MAREIAKVLLDQIARMREQLARLYTVLMMGLKERAASGMECEECQRLWKAYQRATTQSVQLDGEVRSMNEEQGLQQLSETTARGEAAEQLRVEARQRLAEYQAASGHR